MTEVTITLRDHTLNQLLDYLRSHEDDIFHDINDFGELADVFGELFAKAVASV